MKEQCNLQSDLFSQVEMKEANEAKSERLTAEENEHRFVRRRTGHIQKAESFQKTWSAFE